MKYYGEEYLQELTRSLTAVRNSVEYTDYSYRIRNTDVERHRQSLKDRDVYAATQSRNQIEEVKRRVDELQTIITTFYRGVDETASNIISMADVIIELMGRTNASLANIASSLEQGGQFCGTPISASDIRASGIDMSKNEEMYAKFRALAIASDISNDNIDDALVEKHVTYMQYKDKNIEDLTRDEFDLLVKIYDYYCKHRINVPTEDIRDLDKCVISNVINLFELINPWAQHKTDMFFDVPAFEHNAVIDRNISQIKYTIYTADPHFRDILLYYMQNNMVMGGYSAEAKGVYHSSPNTTTFPLAKDFDEKNTDGTYKEDPITYTALHEMGHGIDDQTKLFGDSSSVLLPTLNSDLRKHIVNVLNTSGYSGMDKSDRDVVLDYIFSQKTFIVELSASDKLSNHFPDWTQEQVDAFDCIRKTYGHELWRYQAGTESVYDVVRNDEHSLFDYSREWGTASDTAGGITNNQIGGLYGHKPEIPHDASIIKSNVDLQEALEAHDYWYTKNKQNGHINNEFFANNFRDLVMGIGDENTRMIFPNACDQMDDILKTIYDDIPDQYKGFSY